MKADEQTFRNYLAESDENRRKVYNDLVARGMKADENQFFEYIGYPIQQPEAAPRVDVSDVQQAEQGNTTVAEATEIPTVTMEQLDQQPTGTPAPGSDGHFLGNITVGADGQPKPMEDNPLRNPDNQPAEERTIPEIEVQRQKVDEVSQALSDVTRQRNEQRAQQQREREEEMGFWGRLAKGLQSAENPITTEVVEVITNPTDNDLRAAQNEVRNAKKQLQLEEMRQNGEMKGLAFIRGLETANYYDLIPVLGTADAMSILSLSQALKEGKELTESQQLLLQAMEARAGVDFNYKDNNTIWERVGQSTPEQLMFTLQFVVGAGLTGATEAGERIAAKEAQKAAIRYAKKGVNSGARRFIGGTVIPKLEGMAVSSTIQTFANPLSIASMAEDFERRYAGDIYYDKDGNLHVFDNDRSAGQAAYQAIASAWIENFTEYSGQNITKGIKLADGKMFDLAGKFDNVMKNVGGGRIKDVFTVPQKLSHLTQIGSAPEEFLEEELGSVMNALFATDAQRGESYGDAFKRTISQSFSGEQQLETLLSVTITSTLLGGGGNAVNAVGNAGYRREVNREVERSKALLGKVHGIDIAELDNQIENGQISDIASYLKEQSDANGWSQDEQGAAVSYVLNRARQIGIKHNDDIAIEEAQQEMRQQAEDMANRWDGNIYNATWKDNEGNEQPVTIINGRIHYNTRENGTIHFDPYTSSGMIAIRLSDGTKKQVPSRTITGIQSVMSVDEQLEAQGNTIPQMMQAQFEQEGMAMPTVESVWGGNLVANETQFENGKYTFLGQDQNGLYAFANNDKKTQKDNPIVYMTERQLVEYGLSLNIQAANTTGDAETAQQAQDDLDFMHHLDELTAEATEKDQWDVVKAYASRGFIYEENGMVSVDTNPRVYAAYLLACAEGSFENAMAGIDESVAALVGQQGQQEQAADISTEAGFNAENLANTQQQDGTTAKAIDFYNSVYSVLFNMQAGQQEAIEESANEMPVSQMEAGQEFPVVWNGQPAMATVMEKDADGRSVVTVRDQEGNDVESGIDDWTDEQWEAVRQKPQTEQPETTGLQGLEGYSESDVEGLVRQHIKSALEGADADIDIVGIKVIGSRANGNANEGSDLDVLVEYKGDATEDGLFNLLNDDENRLYIEGIPVDINPITEGKSGTIEQFMARNAGYQKTIEPKSDENEPKSDKIEPKEEVSLSPAQQTFDGLVQKYGDKAGHKIDVTAEDKSKTLDKAKKALEKAQTDYDDAPIGKEEKAEAALQKAQEEYNTALAEKQEWDEVKSVKDRFVAEQIAAKQAAEDERHAQAVAEEEARRAEEERKAHEREATGANNVAQNIREKWEGAPRVEGNADEITLANGERIAGHYVLVESGAASASHDALNGFAKTEGFPLDENEQSVNDRDYERDKNAQQITRQIANEYDSRALQDPVVVSQDGVVLSGNGRTMAGEIAAAQDTDGAYIDYLKKYAPKYGFTPEQVEGMAHPRVVFVPDASMPYTAETFAKFNQQEMKGQSKTEQAVKLGKLVDDATFGRIIRSINRFDTLGDFYADTNATADAIGELLKAGAINQMQHTEMFDGDAISAQGREILENMLIGKAFESNPDAVRQLAAYKSLRQSVITALAEISNNIALGEYSLESELSDAIALAYNARKNGYKAGDAVSEFARQGKLFETEEDATAADYTNATVLMLADVMNDNRVTRLKKVLSVYNGKTTASAGGQSGMTFDEDGNLVGYGVQTKQEILNEVLLLLQHGTESEQQQALDAAREQRKAAAEQGTGVQENGDTVESSEADRGAEETDRGTVEEVHVPQVQEAVEEIDDEGVFPKPDVELERIRSLRQALADGYANHDKEAIQKAVDDLKQYVSEGLDTDGYYSEEIDDYEGDDPMMLAERYITHLYQDRYLDDDEDQEYIRTGLRSDMQAESPAEETEQTAGYTISPAQYTTKRGKVLDMQLVKFDKELTKEQQRAANALARDLKGWWSREDGGFMMRDEATAQQLINAVLEESGETLQEAAPLSLSELRGEAEQTKPTDEAVAAANEEVDTNPTEAQKEAGNYKKGHVTIDGFDISIENPAGSTRSGTDAQGNPWSVTMHNSYGYIRMTEGVDGDHIDIFLSDHIDDWNGTVYVVDQVNEDGSFDEHKVMYGFNSAEEAREAYLSNYSEGWQGLGTITGVSREEFKKWVDSSRRKTKAFADYKSVQTTEGQSEQSEAQRADELFDSVSVGDVFVNDKGLSFTIDRKVDGKTSDTRALRIQWEQQVQDGQNGRGVEIFNTLKFLKYVEDNGMRKASAAMESRTEGTEQEAANTQPTEQPTTSTYGASNKLVSQSRYEELKRKMQEKLGGQMNMGIDPEILAIGTEMAVYHIEAGARKFADFCKNMVADLGDAIRPYLKSFYNGARDLPEMEEAGYLDELTPYEEVKTFDVNGFDKGGSSFVETAQEAVKEAEVEQQAAEAETKLKQQRNDGRKLQDGELSLRPATEADFDSEHPIVYYQGKPYGIIAVMRSGEQVGATQFSKPHLDNVYLTNGESVTIDQLQVVDRDAEEKIKEIAQKGKKTTKKKEKVVSSQPSLFGEETEIETKPQDDGLHRNDVGSSEGLPANGTDSGERSVRTDGKNAGQESGRPDGGGDSRGMGALRQRVPDGLRSSDQLAKPRNTHNNHAERGTDYAPKGVDARIEANIKAIELMQQLIESGEQATPEQMAVLRQFSGWGGLGKAFQENGYGYGSDPTSTSKRLRALLGDEAYEQANMSRNSAYYTPAEVIDTLWDIARAMGFKGGNVLEGSAGIGNIIGLMPTDMSQQSSIHAVEIDQTTGNILSLLYPDAKVEVQGFEATQVENGSVDLAITNVPFVTGLRVNDTTGDKDLSRRFHDIHDFCIAKNIRKLREGGIGIFITSSGTLDNSAKLREWIVNEGGADVVGAFRMNNATFGGTGVTSDIIVVRKRVNGKKSQHAIDVAAISGERVAEYDTGETKKVKGQEVRVVKQLSMDYNKYFIEHPEMMAGDMRFGFEEGETYRPKSKALYPSRGKDQRQMLADFVKSFEGKEWEAALATQQTEQANVYEELGADVKEGSMLVNEDGVLCVAQRGKAVPLEVNANKVKGHTKVECFNAYQAIKQALADVLSYQTENESDDGLQPLLDKLNKAFDSFVKTYGNLHKNTAISFLKNDIDWPNILALEKFSEKAGKNKGERERSFGKTDIFSKRVVEKEKAPEPKNVKDGIFASIYMFGRVDVPYISEHLGMSEEEVREEIIKEGLGFENPSTRQMEVIYEYLSGNVREKLQQAKDNNADGRYDANIKALEEKIPLDIPAHLIEFSIGSSWIDPKLYEEYVKERTDIDVKFTAAGGTWFMKTPSWVGSEKNRSMGVRSELLRKTVFGTELIEAAMTNKTITVMETHKKFDGTTEKTIDKEATQACAAKVDEIRQDFKDWAKTKMQSDTEMSERIGHVYNELFNNYVPKEIPEEFAPLRFSGMASVVKGKPFSMNPHQAKAAIRATTQPLLLAHEVGSGKTITLIATAMEMRRLGTAKKPMIVVQNSTVGQFVESAKQLYPNAKILTIEDSDHNEKGRKDFYAKIKYNDWDMIVVPQSVFNSIPDSEERQMAYIQDKIEEKLMVLEQMRESDNNGKSSIVRQAEKDIDKLQDQLAGLSEAIAEKRKTRDAKKEAVTRQNAEVKALEMLDRKTDDVENFDDMGIDAILVDEAHEYKRLGFETTMKRGVKGIDPAYSKKSQGVFLKAQAVMEKNNGRNVVFATGTPISNTAAEIWTFMRYLMPADTMKQYGIYYFDDFVRNFGNIQQMLEFSTSGEFKENTRFAGYVNLPELVRIWSGVADTVLNDDIEEDRKRRGIESKIPETEMGGKKAQDIYLPQTKALRSVMKYVKQTLKEYEKMSGKDKKANSHIPLVMFGIATAAAVDVRLVLSQEENTTSMNGHETNDDNAVIGNSYLDDPNSKTNEAVRQTLKALEDSKEYRGTCVIFADHYKNKKSGFNLYEDIRNKLIAAGVPEDEVVVMNPKWSDKKKLQLFEKMKMGEIRVMLGSTFTLGTGVNIQDRLFLELHLDAPIRPMDYTQRVGRILRQGNMHKQWGKPVRLIRLGVEDSLDVTAYQRLQTKGAIADSIMHGKDLIKNGMENRVMEESEDAFGDTVAQLSGSQFAMRKNQAEREVRKLQAKKKQWEADQTYVHNRIPKLEGSIRASQRRLEEEKGNLEKLSSIPEHPTITIGKHTFKSLEDMADFIKEYNAELKQDEAYVRGNMSSGQKKERTMTVNVGGIDFKIRLVMSLTTEMKAGTLTSVVKRDMTYSCEELGMENMPVHQMLFRNALEDILTDVVTGVDSRDNIESAQRVIDRDNRELEQLKARNGKPFENEKDLQEAQKLLEEYTAAMKKEMEEKEAKYADMDSEVEAATGLTEAEVAEEEDEEEETPDLSITEDMILSLREEERIAFNAVMDALGNAGIEVVMATQEDVEKLKASNRSIQDSKGTVRGWVGNDGRIYLTSEGMSAETPIHEYTHLWAEALQMENPELWEQIKDLLKDTPEWKRIASSVGYKHIRRNEDRLAGEVLAHISGKKNAERMEAEAKRMIDEAPTLEEAAKAANLLGRMRDALKKFWTWVGKTLLGKKGNINIDQVSNMVLADLTNGIDPFNPNRGKRRSRKSTDVDLSIAGPDNAIAGEYNRMTGYNSEDVSGYVKVKEELLRSFFDGLRPLEQMQQLVEKSLGRKLRDSENAYGLATLLPSLNKAMMYKAETEFMLPVLRQSAKLIKAAMKSQHKGRNEAKEMLNNYLLAKHGLERNEWFYQQALANDPDAEEEDKAGLRGLAESLGENPDEYKSVAEKLVKDFEDEFDGSEIDAYWASMKALTDRMLEISYESGMIGKDAFESLKARHQYYVPLRGFADGTSGDLFDYVSRHPHFQSVFKKMKGRKSKADDPLANLYNMLQSAIVIGNQNKVMQNIYNLAVNAKSDLLRVNRSWYVYNDATDEWEERFPDIPEDATADEIDAIMKQFDADMQQLKQQGKAEQYLNKMNLGKRVLPYQAKEHEMTAYINGRKVMMHVAGNPLVAQQLNKSNTQQLGWFAETVQSLTRFASRINTSLSPAFMFTNAARDIGFSLYSATVTGGLKKNLQMVGNLFRAGWVLPRLILTGKMGGGITKMFSPTEAAKIEQWWNEFLDNGGETGFTNTLSAEKAKGQVDDMIRRMINYRSKDGQLRLKKATLGVIETMGRYSEDISRFAAYCLKRAEGETVKASVNEAKNVTVNFNVKGGGNSMVARFVAGCRSCYSFFNASLQGINRMGRLAKENPKAFAACLMACVVQGAMLPWLNMALFAMLGGDDDDWEKYEMLSEYTANHNLIIFVGNHKFLKIPYSQELAPFAAMGNIWFRQQMGWNHGRSIASQIGNMFLDLSPVNIGESKTTWGKLAKTITPTIAMPLTEWALNENFTASPIEKRYEWNKFDSGWEKAYESRTSKWLIDATRYLDEKTNGTIDINPSFVEHIATGMLGGIGRSGDNLMRYFSDGFQTQNAPYLRTIMFDSKQQGYIGAVSREYGRLAYEVLPEVKHDVDRADMLEFARLANTQDYQIANVVSIYKTGKDLLGNKTSFQGIDKLEKAFKKAQKESDGSESANEYLQAMRDQINEMKMEMLDAIDEVIYNNSGAGRRSRIDRVREIERDSKEKYQREHSEE